MVRSDIEIAQSAKMKNINEIAVKIGLNEEDYSVYGKYKAKVNYKVLDNFKYKKDAKVILVTAINPTPKGEGKTTTTVGLGDAFNLLGKKSIICLREPSLGPVFGMKGGAAGGGYSQVIPMEDINLHFTGDIHAIGTANNLLAAMVDNHIFQGNKLNIDVRRVTWRRVLDINDRQLRNIVSGLGSRANGVPREDSFDITVASEIMAVFCLSNSLEDLKEKLSNMIVAYTHEGLPVYCKDLNAEGALTTLLKESFNPNLVQTLEHTPAFIHGGPFANIAHGCNSLISTKLAMKLCDYVITESGFGADLGAEKFLDIKCRKGNLVPSVVVIVATISALKHHGGGEGLGAIEEGSRNLKRHIDNITKVFGLPVVIAINKFNTDTSKEINLLTEICNKWGVSSSISTVYEDGGAGGCDLASKVLSLVNNKNDFNYAYDENTPIVEKITNLAKKVYGANSVNLSMHALKSINDIERLGYGNLPICIAKTQYSFSDNPKLLGAPLNFELNVNDVRLSAGAGFIVAVCGNIMTMPGLPKLPSAEKINVNSEGIITGLF